MSTFSAFMMVSRLKARSSRRAANRARSMNVRSVLALFSWPCATTRSSSVKIADDRPDVTAELARRTQAAVAVGNLVAVRHARLGTHQDRHLLPGLADRLDEQAVILLRSLHAVGNDGIVDRDGIEFDGWHGLRQATSR